MEEINQDISKKERREIKREEKVGEISKDRNKRVIKKLLAWLIALGLISVAVYALVVYEQGVTEKVGVIGEVRAEDWTRGKSDASVVLVEYSDFQCPACAAYEPILQGLLKEFPNDLLLVYRHFPLTSIHANAEDAGWSSEAAGKQDKFWEMHDLLFERQSVWSVMRDPKETFLAYAKELELNSDKFQTDYESNTIKDLVSNSLDEARAAGFTGTPTFILNGEKLISSPQTLEAFIKLIRENI